MYHPFRSTRIAAAFTLVCFFSGSPVVAQISNQQSPVAPETSAEPKAKLEKGLTTSTPQAVTAEGQPTAPVQEDAAANPARAKEKVATASPPANGEQTPTGLHSENSQTVAPDALKPTVPNASPEASAEPEVVKPKTQPEQPSSEKVEVQPPAKPHLVVSSWAGAYGDAQDKAIIAPLARILGIDIERRARSAKVGTADVTELDQSSLMAACRSGAVLKIQSPLPRPDDFLAGSVTDCGVPTFAWSSMLIANGEAMKRLAKRRYRAPSELKHLLEPKVYPGKRALIKSPKRLLEMMLLGDGAERQEVYNLLATREGQDRAFVLLDRLSEAGAILWVDGPRAALQALDRSNVTMAMTYSGRAFRRLIASRLRPIWDGHIIDYASWAVPATSSNRTGAERFILAATSAESLAAQARLWPYGPMRRSALALAKRHALLDTDLDAFMPTSELRFGQGLLFSAAFWSKHASALQDRFVAWLSGVPLGFRVPFPEKAPPLPMPPLPGVAPAVAAQSVQ